MFMCNLNAFRPLLWSCLVLSVFGCKKDAELGIVDSDYAILISYEEETRSSYSNLHQASTVKTDADLLAQETQCLRQKIKIGIMDDGSSTMRITRMEPKHAVSISEKVSLSRESEVHSLLFENGQVTLFDVKGNQIGRETTEMPSYKSLVTRVRQNKNSLTRAMYSEFLAGQRLKSTETGELKVKEEGDITITEELVGPDDGLDPSITGYTVSNYFETASGVLIGSSILDKTGTTIFRSVMTYDEDALNPLPAFSHEESFSTGETGETSIVTTLRYVENVEIVVE
jgi:hypothetical protein